MAVLFVQKDCVKSGGIERVNSNLAQAIRDLGYSVHFYIMNSNHDSEEGCVELSKQFEISKSRSEDSLLKKLLLLRSIVKEYGIKTIISATEQANTLTYLLKLSGSKVSVIYTRHVAFDEKNQSLPAWAIKLLYSFYLTSGNVVTVSKALRNELKQNVLWNKSNVFFVPNAVVSDRLLNAAVAESSLQPSVDYFIAVGRLVEQKGFDLLLHSYAAALKTDADLPSLLIIGEGQDRDMLESIAGQLNITEKVIFGGFTNNPYALINNAKALILSSRYEGMPTVIIESMSLNTPVIAFDCPTGPNEIVKTGENGILVKYLDTNLLAQAITQYKSLNYDGIDDYVSDFVFEHVANRYLEIATLSK